jgi:hypothetical protein
MRTHICCLKFEWEKTRAVRCFASIGRAARRTVLPAPIHRIARHFANRVKVLAPQALSTKLAWL